MNESLKGLLKLLVWVKRNPMPFTYVMGFLIVAFVAYNSESILKLWVAIDKNSSKAQEKTSIMRSDSYTKAKVSKPDLHEKSPPTVICSEWRDLKTNDAFLLLQDIEKLKFWFLSKGQEIEYMNEKEVNIHLVRILASLNEKQCDDTTRSLYKCSLAALVVFQNKHNIFKYEGNIGDFTIKLLEEAIQKKFY